MKSKGDPMVTGETYTVTETALGWNAPGLFRWEKAQKELLASEMACSVLIEDQVWLVKAMEHLDESMKGFTFEFEGVEKARAIFPHAAKTVGVLIWENRSYNLSSEGAYKQLFSEDGKEVLRIVEGWKDSDRELGIRHRIEVFDSSCGLLAAIAYGNVLKFLGSPALYSPPNNSAGLVRGQRPNDQNKAVLPWFF